MDGLRALTNGRPEKLQLEVISDLDRFRALGPEWDRLTERAAIGHLFLSHTWLTTWWECFGGGKQLHIVTLRARGKLIAAAPMMVMTARIYGIKVRRLESIYNYHTPRYDFIVAGHEDEVYGELWQSLSSGRGAWDVVVLAQVPENSPTLAQMTVRAEADGWKTGEWTARVSPYIPLPADYDRFFNGLKRNYRYNLRKRYEKLCGVGPVDVEVITQRSAVRDAMQDGLRIEAAAWKGATGTAINSDPAVAEFYIRLGERAAELGWLRLTFLRIAGKRIAFNYVLRSGKTICGVKIGYDPKYHTYSPSNMLLNLILQEACEEGITEYDFIGADDEWKFDWTQSARRHTWLFLFRNAWRPRLLHHLKFNVLPRARRLKQTVLEFRRTFE